MKYTGRLKTASPPSSSATGRGAAVALATEVRLLALEADVCSGREPPKRAVTGPRRPYKNAVERKFTAESAKGASPPREGRTVVVAVHRELRGLVRRRANVSAAHGLCGSTIRSEIPAPPVGSSNGIVQYFLGGDTEISERTVLRRSWAHLVVEPAARLSDLLGGVLALVAQPHLGLTPHIGLQRADGGEELGEARVRHLPPGFVLIV